MALWQRTLIARKLRRDATEVEGCGDADSSGG
jgi:hypothetical protein